MKQEISRKNNFDFLRLMFSSLVIYSHSFPLSGNNKETLSVLTIGQTDFGKLSVNVFFAMSGYLILNSLKYSKTALSFVWKRLLRLFPGLFFMLLFTLLLILLINTGTSVFSLKGFYTYLPNNMTLYRVQYSIGEIFASNPYPKTLNGSIWSLCYEFSMYLFILLLFPFRNNRVALLTILFLSFSFTFYAANFNSSLWAPLFNAIRLDAYQFYRLSTYFIAGSILSLSNLEKINYKYIKFILLIIIVVSIVCKVYDLLSYIILPLLVLLIALSYSKILAYIPNRIGDISYGVYIYAFFIQQTLMHFYTFNVYSLMICSLAITYVLSYLSWHFVEKKFLRYKDLLK